MTRTSCMSRLTSFPPRRRAMPAIVCSAMAILALLLDPNMATAQMRGVSPYLPLRLSPLAERKIEQALILANKPIVSRPIRAATLLDALPEVCEIDPLLCNQIRQYLQPYMQDFGVTDLSFELSPTSTDSRLPAANGRGSSVDSEWRAMGRVFYQPLDRLLLSGGVLAYDGRTEPTGTMLSAGVEYAQLDIGYRDHWLSPFNDSSMLIGTQAPNVPSITLSSYAPVSILGFTYEVFLGELSHSDDIGYQGGLTAGNPRLAGLSFQFEPVSGYAVSLNRVLQFGGGARGGTGFRDFKDALFNTGSADNTGTDADFGNQVASLTSRIVFPGRTPLSVYFEYAGEDRSFSGQRRLGNVSLSAGVDFASIWNGYDLTYELSDWQNSWYSHHIYGDGLTNHGNVIGHWFGDHRVFNDSVGGRSHMLRVGKRFMDRSYGQITYRTLENEAYSPNPYEQMQELSVQYHRPWRQHVIGTGLTFGQDVFGEEYARLEASLRLYDNWLSDTVTSGARRRDEDRVTEFFFDFGASTGYIDTYLTSAEDFDENGNPIWRQTSYSQQPHIGIGVRRRVSENSDLGTRIEWDRVGGYDLVSIRALDYRRRFGQRIAFTGFFGAGRYNLGTAAYGYYAGIGGQIRDVLPGWDLSLDLRFHDKMARDKLLPSDPPPTATNNDMFFDLSGLAAYLSYRF